MTRSIYRKATESAIEAVRSVLPAMVNPERPDAVQVSRPSDALAAKRLTEVAGSRHGFRVVAVAVAAHPRSER
jgi:hypothetical protein